MDRHRNRERLERAVVCIAEKLNDIGLSLELRKTALVEFNKSEAVNRDMFLRIKNQCVENERGAKFLGVWFDNQIKFLPHVSHIRGRMDRANSILRYLSGVTRGAEMNTALMLYKSLVRSVADYGCFIYAPHMAEARLKLERGQFAGLRTALGYRNSTPTNVIVAKAKVPLLRERALTLAKNYCSKVYKYGQMETKYSLMALSGAEHFARYRNPMQKLSVLTEAWDAVFRMSDILGPSQEGYPLWECSFQEVTEGIRVNFDIGSELANRKKADCDVPLQATQYTAEDLAIIRKVICKHQLPNDPLVAYTDGSRLKGSLSTGAAVIMDEMETAYCASLPCECSVYTAECFAIWAALDLARTTVGQEEYRSRRALIVFSDCSSALQALSSNRLNVFKNIYVLRARRVHFDLQQRDNLQIVYVWVPSHRGITGNEMADILAKEGARGTTTREIEVPISDCVEIFAKTA
ncbi:hypothetical protein DMN91_004109 [Ooceraea biroi]|uniref:RNase H type-1 domain-containing protein n=1 Tax=Ooceraea biroi TaxID=2015173 RepID=A0A3L8DU52_OOCBI|nr:hypothetical protein DMN91_004109 [Ooceraea biroi]